jgi:tetratricopeptide (TPR) repeat protein
MFKFAISICLFAFVLIQPAAAQSLGANRGESAGTDGGRSIQGRIIFASGTPPATAVRITLETPYSGTRTTFADLDGVFTFNNLGAGPYQLTVNAGKEYELARESINIEGPAPVYQVPIYLRPNLENNPGLAGVPQAAYDFYTKGTDAAAKGDSKKAAEMFEQAVKLHPTFTMALAELGMQYMRLGQMDKAGSTFRALLKIKDTDASAHLNLGIALYNLSSTSIADKNMEEASQRLSEAEHHLTQAIKLNSRGPNAHYYLGLVSIRLRKYKEAQSEMELAISNGGENLAPAHKYLGGLYMSAKKNKEAADQLEKYLQLEPKANDAEKIRGTIKELRSKQ